jgi:serine/threonine-protein kinase
MQKKHWKTIESIYEQALTLQPKERDTFVNKESNGNNEIFQQVITMLKLEDDSDFMSGIPVEITTDALDKQTDVSQIGHFKILEKIAVGGMGVVYKAQSTLSDVAIIVALKTIRNELKTQEMESRFFNEKTILSKLKHKNIASLIDAGISDSGIPYIATQWIQGTNIIAYADEHKLDLKTRLKLFLQLGSALSYAHNQLIIHRDLKPANILIDENRQVKLLDFGIAKLVDEENVNNTQTQIFTPNYAAPEQINGKASTVFTDVYALGVLLFELLTSQKRFHLNDLTLPERIKLICQPTIINASQRVSNHHPVPANKLKGALNTIINKAMHVDEARRYESVAALMDDINRYKDNRPIKAIKDSWIYLGSMFLKRNKWSSIMAFLVVISLVSGMFISLHQTKIAKKEVEKSKQLQIFFNKSLQSASPLQGGSTKITVREMFTKGSENFNLGEIADPLTRAEIASEIALIFTELEDYSASTQYIQYAIDFYDLNIENYANEYLHHTILLSGYLLTQVKAQKALAVLNSSYKKAKVYKIKPGILANTWINFGAIYKELNQPEQALTAYNKAENYAIKATDLESLGKVYYYKFVLLKEVESNQILNDLIFKAKYNFEQSYKNDNHPDLIAVRNSLAMHLTNQGDYIQANTVFENLVSQVSSNSEKINYNNFINHANVKYYLGEFQQAINFTSIALDRMHELNLQTGFSVMSAKIIQARALTELKQFNKADAFYNEARKFFSTTFDSQHIVMMTLNIYHMDHYLKSNQTDKALALSVGIAEFTEEQLNETPSNRNRYINSMTTLGCLYSQLNQHNEALNYFLKANKVLQSNTKKQGWIYWVIQAGIEKSHYKLKNGYNDKQFQLAYKNLFTILQQDNWFTQFFDLDL